jgi:SAM-dependent methyltransferase
MDVSKALQVWKRILREDALFEALESADFKDRLSQLELTRDEFEIALAYARHGGLIKFPRSYFQFAAQQQVLVAASQHAPLTVTLLMGQGCNLDELALGHLRARGWPDYGPYLCRGCEEFLGYLLERSELAAIPGFEDVVALEIANVSLLGRLSNIAAELWIAPETPDLFEIEALYQRTPGAVALTLDHIITPLLMDPEGAGGEPLEPGCQHFLVFLTSVDEEVGYAVLQDEAKIIFDALDQPRSLSEAAALLGGDPEQAREDAHSALIRFLNLGVIRPLGGSYAQRAVEPSRARATWDDVAMARGSGQTECFDALVETMLERCGDLEDKKVLDIGMGNGLSTLALARRGAHALGIDISARAVEGANALISTLPEDVASRLSYRVMDATSLGLPEASFDVVTCLKTIWCFPDPVQALREFHRVLRPGGLIVIQLWGAECTLSQAGASVLERFNPHQGQPQAVAGPRPDMSPGQLEQLLHEAGFSALLAEPAYHARTFAITSPAHFWDLYRSVADGGYYDYARHSTAEKAAMDEHWLMETSSVRGQSSTTPLELAWYICGAQKPE